ncbi:monoheme cytochrome C [Winogradskyella sp. A2]|uniref:monoheme cytochrome C n=1 Tax=Winogradskyella sp. A2 TaxID=3366944 RepID=UPI00398C8196
MGKEPSFNSQVRSIYQLLMVLFLLFVIAGGSLIYYVNNPGAFSFKKKSNNLVAIPIEDDSDRIENGIHLRTGLIEAEGLMTVVNNCTNCHSAKLVTQNRMSADSWNSTIKWMQETQNLWDLGGNQEIIVNYLVANYPPIAKGRRMILTNVDWYELEE